MHQPAFKPGRCRIHQTFVLRNVLFLDHGDFGVKFSAEVAGVEACLIHIVVHGLLFGGHDDGGVEPRQRICRAVIGFSFHVVPREAMFRNRRPARHNFGKSAHQLFGFDAVLKVQKIGVTIEVIEVLQKRKVQGLLDVRVGFSARENGGKLDGKLLVTDGGFQNGFAYRF